MASVDIWIRVIGTLVYVMTIVRKLDMLIGILSLQYIKNFILYFLYELKPFFWLSYIETVYLLNI